MTTRDYIKFLKISAGSLNEMEAIAEIAIGQKMISEPHFQKQNISAPPAGNSSD